MAKESVSPRTNLWATTWSDPSWRADATRPYFSCRLPKTQTGPAWRSLTRYTPCRAGDERATLRRACETTGRWAGDGGTKMSRLISARRPISYVAAGLAVAAVLALLSWPPRTTAESKEVSLASSAHEVDSRAETPQLDAAAEAIEGLGRDQYPDTFGGLVMDAADGTLTLFVTDPDSTETQQLVQAAASQPLTVKTVNHSWASLVDLRDHIVGDIPTLQKQGIPIVAVGPDPGSNTVDIGVTGSLEASRQALTATYGTENVTVEQSGQPYATADRFGDTPPYNGGD